MPESSDAVTSGDEIDLDAQPMLNTQTSTATTTITAKDIIINRIWTKNVKRALVLLVPTFFVLYIWYEDIAHGDRWTCMLLFVTVNVYDPAESYECPLNMQ